MQQVHGYSSQDGLEICQTTFQLLKRCRQATYRSPTDVNDTRPALPMKRTGLLMNY